MSNKEKIIWYIAGAITMATTIAVIIAVLNDIIIDPLKQCNII